jgi:hypothetical protein
VYELSNYCPAAALTTDLGYPAAVLADLLVPAAALTDLDGPAAVVADTNRNNQGHPLPPR